VGDLWLPAPLTLKAYVVISVGWALVAVALGIAAVDPLRIFVGLLTLPVSAAICFFLLRGSEALWWVVLALGVIGLALAPIPPGLAWYYIVLEVILLALLVAPDTRRHCGIGRQPSL
jgi:hypothetical protein